MTLGTILWWILIGFVAGAIAKLIMPGKDPGGWIITILLGIAGAFVGGWLFGMLEIAGGGFTTLIGAIIGALILLAIYRLIAGRRPA
jgi:uncharacterized membrane protein YeaQ/YmgE (transglycosylase-associated protein family)